MAQDTKKALPIGRRRTGQSISRQRCQPLMPSAAQSLSCRSAATVMAGSNPYESHWKGKVSGLAMPPNKVAITEADASKLVSWILQLK